MAPESAWTFAGGKTTIVQGLECSNKELTKWFRRVIDFILRIAASADFEVVDNGYRSFPGVLVTNGVKCYFRGTPFEIWSDVPGEIIIRHESMGYRLGNELIGRLEALWPSMVGEERHPRP